VCLQCSISAQCTAVNLTCRSGHQLVSVYLADGGGALLVVKVWNGLKVRMEARGREGEDHVMLSKGVLSLTCLQARALEDLVIPGALVAVSNLSYRGIGYSHHLPTANAGDRCVVSQHPREHHLKSALEEVSHELPVSECVCVCIKVRQVVNVWVCHTSEHA